MSEKASNTSLRALSEKNEGIKRVNQFRVKPSLLKIRAGENLRIAINSSPARREHVNGLKAAIKRAIQQKDPNKPDNKVANGLKEVFPSIQVKVEDGQIWVIDGEHRTVAIQELNEEGYDIQFVDVDPQELSAPDQIALMVSSSRGMHLTPLEKGYACLRLVDDHGMRFSEVGTLLGMTTQRVEQLVLLSRTPQAVHDLVASRAVTADFVIEYAREYRDDPDGLVHAVQQAVIDSTAAKAKKTKDEPAVDDRTHALFPEDAQPQGEAAQAEESDAPVKASRPVGRSRENISAPVRREMFNHMRANASHLRDSIDAAMKAAALSDDGAAEDETTVAVELPVSVVKALLASMGEKGDE